MVWQKISISNMAETLGNIISAKTENQDNTNLLTYGAEILLGSIIKILLIVFLSSLLGTLKETLVIVMAAGLFRLLTGGVHATAYYRCLLLSLVVFLSLGYLLDVGLYWIVSLNSLYLAPIVLIGLYWVICYAPVPPDNKPLENDQDLKKRKFYSILVCSGIIALLYINLNWFTLAMVVGATWQAFTLTPRGYKVISYYDTKLAITIAKEVKTI